MKKLITLLSLTMAMTAFGAPQGNTEKSGDMNISATVIKPLTVRADKSMEFGKVIQGTTASATSSYSIEGEKGELITVDIPSNVELSNGTNKINVGIVTKNLPHSLDSEGKNTFTVDGIINTAPDQAVGEYSGTLTARVQYN